MEWNWEQWKCAVDKIIRKEVNVSKTSHTYQEHDFNYLPS